MVSLLFLELLDLEVIMKIFKAIFIALAITSASHIHAALPPLYQTVDEIQSIIKSDQLGKVLPSGEAIVEIHKNENGYEVMTNRHRVQVQITHLPLDRPGPALYQVHFNEAEERLDSVAP